MAEEYTYTYSYYTDTDTDNPEERDRAVKDVQVCIQDLWHMYAPKCTLVHKHADGIPRRLIVPPQTLDEKHYDPIQALPPLCDDPTNPMFYINDTRPDYQHPPLALAAPVCIIRGKPFLTSSSLTPSQEKAVSIAEKYAMLYCDAEIVYGRTVGLLAQYLFRKLHSTEEVLRSINETIEDIKKSGVHSAVSFDFQTASVFSCPDNARLLSARAGSNFEGTLPPLKRRHQRAADACLDDHCSLDSMYQGSRYVFNDVASFANEPTRTIDYDEFDGLSLGQGIFDSYFLNDYEWSTEQRVYCRKNRPATPLSRVSPAQDFIIVRSLGPDGVRLLFVQRDVGRVLTTFQTLMLLSEYFMLLIPAVAWSQKLVPQSGRKKYTSVREKYEERSVEDAPGCCSVCGKVSFADYDEHVRSEAHLRNYMKVLEKKFRPHLADDASDHGAKNTVLHCEEQASDERSEETCLGFVQRMQRHFTKRNIISSQLLSIASNVAYRERVNFRLATDAVRKACYALNYNFAFNPIDMPVSAASLSLPRDSELKVWLADVRESRAQAFEREHACLHQVRLLKDQSLITTLLLTLLQPRIYSAGTFLAQKIDFAELLPSLYSNMRVQGQHGGAITLTREHLRRLTDGALSQRERRCLRNLIICYAKASGAASASRADPGVASPVTCSSSRYRRSGSSAESDAVNQLSPSSDSSVLLKPLEDGRPSQRSEHFPYRDRYCCVSENRFELTIAEGIPRLISELQNHEIGVCAHNGVLVQLCTFMRSCLYTSLMQDTYHQADSREDAISAPPEFKVVLGSVYPSQSVIDQAVDAVLQNSAAVDCVANTFGMADNAELAASYELVDLVMKLHSIDQHIVGGLIAEVDHIISSSARDINVHDLHAWQCYESSSELPREADRSLSSTHGRQCLAEDACEQQAHRSLPTHADSASSPVIEFDALSNCCIDEESSEAFNSLSDRQEYYSDITDAAHNRLCSGLGENSSANSSTEDIYSPIVKPNSIPGSQAYLDDTDLSMLLLQKSLGVSRASHRSDCKRFFRNRNDGVSSRIRQSVIDSVYGALLPVTGGCEILQRTVDAHESTCDGLVAFDGESCVSSVDSTIISNLATKHIRAQKVKFVEEGCIEYIPESRTLLRAAFFE